MLPRRSAPRGRGTPTPPTEQTPPVAEVDNSRTQTVIPKEDFGRDKDLKSLLKSVQPEAFSGEGVNVANVLEEWIISMDDYFSLAEYNFIAQGIMGREPS